MILLLYQLAFPLVLLGVLLKFLLAGRAGALRERAGDLRERLGLGSVEPAPRTVWFHAASVGEVTALGPFLAELGRRPGRPRVLLTTSTTSGREKARALPGVDVALLAPADIYPAVSAFLARARPTALILAETEFWPMTLSLAARRGLRLGLVNGRVTERAFKRYRWIGRSLAAWLAPMERAAVRSEEDSRRLRALGVPEAALKVTGSTKYDLPAAPAGADARGYLRELGWEGASLWTAGSTRPGEEETILAAHHLARGSFPDLKLLLVPRHPERAAEVRGACAEDSCRVVDRMGLLPSLYAASAAAFVGGTLVPIGGHNLLEPASRGIPVLFGPHTDSVREEAAALRASGGGREACSAEALAEALRAWLADPAARERAAQAARRTAADFAGASDRALAHLAPLLGL